MKRFLLIALILLAVTSCRTKKVALDKNTETVSVLQQNDVQLSEKERVETSTLDLTTSSNFSITPVDSQKSSKVIYKGDTLSFVNARLEMNKTEANYSSVTSGSKEKDHIDKSVKETEAKSSSKKRNSELKSPGWGLNLAIIFASVIGVVLLYFHFRKKLPTDL